MVNRIRNPKHPLGELANRGKPIKDIEQLKPGKQRFYEAEEISTSL